MIAIKIIHLYGNHIGQLNGRLRINNNGLENGNFCLNKLAIEIIC